MKNLKITLSLLISLIFAGNSYAWTITNFHSDIVLNSDGSANVTETITGDFSRDLRKHGIYRYIPFQSVTDTGMLNRTPISQFSVTNEQKIPRNFQQTIKNNNILLTIGHPNKYVKSREIYIIKYKIDRVPKEFPENNFAEFYWNVTGNDWETIIQKASATISLPKHSQINKTICFTGKYESKEQNCTAFIDGDGNANFAGNSSLQVGEGLTIDYGFDKGLVQTFKFEENKQKIVKNPAKKSAFVDFFNKIGVWIVSFLAFLFPTFFAWKEKKKVAVDKPIIPKYNPPAGFHPSMLGTVIDGKFDKHDFTAGIIDLAVNGYLTIEKKEVKGLVWNSEEYVIKRNPAKKEFSTDIQEELYTRIFRPSLATGLTGLTAVLQGNIPDPNILEEEFVPANSKSKMFSIFQQVELKIKTLGKQYFRAFSGITIISFLIPVIPIGMISIMSKSGNLGNNTLFIIIGGFFAGIMGMALLTPKRTKEGMELAHEAKCYREFLETAEIDQLNWAEKQEIFEKNLPYAVAFGLTDKWAKVFGDTIVEPKWMHGTGGVGNLAKNLDDITADIAGNISAPRNSSGGSGFGGGGFSGGGSGGGGGGSW